MQIVELKTQNLFNPIGIQTLKPVFGWKLKAEENGQKQTAYRIVAATAREKLDAGEYDIWDSGKIVSDHNYGIVYEGKELVSMERVYWKVCVWDKDEMQTAFSESAFWEMGLLDTNDWQGKWITAGESANAPILSKAFSINNRRKLRSARLYISGLGLYEAHINGVTLGEGTYFNPGESDSRDTVYYNTYDITELVHADKQGGQENAVSILLGNGQYANYRIHRQSGRYYKTDDSRSKAAAAGMFGAVKGIAQIVLTYEDGFREVIGTDESWSYTESPITENSWYGGEDYDATLEIEGWDNVTTAIPRDQWGKAKLVSSEEIPTGMLKGREFEPISIQQADTISSDQITVERLSESEGTVVYLVDMGRNGAGFPEIRLRNTKAGQMIRMYPAEVNEMNGFAGHINQASCTQSDSNNGNLIYDTYITKGGKKEVWHPRFCYHGYRYLEAAVPAEIKLSPENFTGYILRTDNNKNGSFSCSDESLNQINVLTERSIESNMYSTFTDCPQIEKLGWLETPGLMFESMAHTYDISTWIPKLVQDMADAQYENGRIAAIAPEYFKIGALYEDLNWNGSMIVTAWQYYETYGNKEIFSNGHYAAMKKYMDYLENEVADDNMITSGQMGEWGEMTIYGTTPVVLVETTAYYQFARTMSEIAKVLEKPDDQQHYFLLAEAIQKAFHRNSICCNEKNLYGNGTQSGYGCVLYSGIVLEKNRAETAERLVKAIKAADYHLTSGEVGLKQVFGALAENGRSDIIYKMVTNKTMPSYRYFLEKGLTTLPEYWNFEDLWGSVARSLNHAMMGHVKEWFTRYLAGIRRQETAYRTVLIKPAVIDVLTEVNGAVDTIHGLIVSNWKRNPENDSITMEINIPIGVSAFVQVPLLKEGQRVTCNGKSVAVTQTEDNYQALSEILNSGMYRIAAK